MIPIKASQAHGKGEAPAPARIVGATMLHGRSTFDGGNYGSAFDSSQKFIYKILYIIDLLAKHFS
jgi:hypothetical protein